MIIDHMTATDRIGYLENLLKLEQTTLESVTEQRDRLAEAIHETLMQNLHLADGDDCTLKRLKDSIQFELPNE
jgi:hypothetical protein